MPTRRAIVGEAHRWLDTRWHHQASVRGAGADCVGVIVGVGAAFGLAEAGAFKDDLDFAGYGREPSPLVYAACDRYMDRVEPIEAMQPGDVLVMWYDPSRQPRHLALFVGGTPPMIIHALAMARKVAKHRLDSWWSSRILRVYAYRGVTA